MKHDQAVLQIVETARNHLESSGRPYVGYTGKARMEKGGSLARYFDHTLLKPDATAAQYEELCDQALELTTRSVCIPPDRISLCARRLEGSVVEVCTVIGFPLGYHSTAAKVEEVRMAGGEGATEFDMVIPIGRLRDGDPSVVYDDVRAVVDAAEGMIVKVILETALLSPDQKIQAAYAAIHAGGAILKTSTGFASAGATVQDIEILRLIAGTERGVKAAGGIRTLEFARQLIEAGADRLGASATISILGEAAGEKGVLDNGEGGY